ncbi:MAG: uridine kinase [Dictyoglomaceae bacterium]
MNRPVLIGIAGGTGSGKTTLAQKILESFPKGEVVVISQDSYYLDQSHLPLEERRKINYDHPLAFDFPLLIEHLEELKKGNPIYCPTYSFSEYIRLPEKILIEPKPVIILEGILVLEEEEIRNLLDIKIFVDCDPDVRFIRRLLRDIKERKRTVEQVVDQYLTTVRPMHLQFVEPSKKYADIIIPEGGFNKVALELIIAKIKSILGESHVEGIEAKKIHSFDI